ncbi:aminoglycoside phosphotransferase family protein [Yinghuangia soli]|uniref:Aminoglycoside phosphotransferase family protein n=1 Tax=Yinghuangia soli TaxID=2908204 RepID=A0AA41Q7X8_9ACTN|nr:aminoglycoside phosphotransferase family protein [Yinghuangia soli]MCF2533254.1 aminoglycoside phosphotransferase family protein [Yinghuangia soli]
MSALQMHPGQHPVDEALVRRLVAAQFPQWADLPVVRVPSGGTVNAMYRLGDAMAVRLPLLADGAPDVRLEQEWLPRLAGRLSTAIPVVLGAGEPGEGYPWPWSVLRWLPGEIPQADALAEPELLAADLAAFVTEMRGSLPVPDPATKPKSESGPAAGAPIAHRGGPIASLDRATRSALAELRGIAEEKFDWDAVEAVWDAALRAPGPDGPPVWLHADLMPGNLLLDGAGRLAAVIDFGCLGLGDPACDLFPAWNLLPAAGREAFRKALDADDAAWTRGRGRTLSQALIALPYYRTTNQAMAANARHVLGAVLADVEAASVGG